MSAPRLALVFLAAAAALYLGVTRPKTRALLAATEEYGKLRQAQAAQDAQLERADLEARESAQALRALTTAAAPSLPELRSRVLARLSALPVDDVQLALIVGRSAAPVEVKLQAQGELADLVALASGLAAPRSGLALKGVSLERGDRDSHVKLTLTASSVGTRP
jgi:hypothetical protein